MRRRLTPLEITEARLVFGDGINYDQVWIAENEPLPNTIGDIGAALSKTQRAADNAVVIGDTVYFPREVAITPEMLEAKDLTLMAWLVHELTHIWQYERRSWAYLTEALQVQVQMGAACYDYNEGLPSKEDALRAAHQKGKKFDDFNVEQQGDIARDYYWRLKNGWDVSPWEPYLPSLRTPVGETPKMASLLGGLFRG